MEEKIKFLLNGLFATSERRDKESDEVARASIDADIEYRYHDYRASLEEAALDWMLLEIDAYLTLLTSRNCSQVKVWKTVGQWKEFDVFFNIQAKGRPAPQFGIKAYVVFPQKDVCRFKLEDWGDGSRVSVDGRVITTGNKLFKCGRLVFERNPGSSEDDYDDEVLV